MGRRPAYSLAGLPFAFAVLAFASAASAQQQPLVVPPAEASPIQAPPEAPPIQAPPETPPAEPPAETPPVQPPVATPPVQAPAVAQPIQASPAIPGEQPPEMVEEELLSLGPPQRPRLSLAVGMGVTCDPAGFMGSTNCGIPAFFGVGGFGDGLLGVDLGAFSSAASGRSSPPDSPVDRLALDAFGVLRPAARLRPGDQRYFMRVVRTIGAELGLGFERDGQVAVSGKRWVIHTGARIEFPLTSGQAGELRLRLAVRRAFGLYTPELSRSGSPTISVGDSTELYAALAVVF